MGGITRALCLLAIFVAPQARAEWSVDFYGGVAYSPRSDFTLQVRPPGLNFDHTFYNAKWDSSPTFGVRGGYWLERLPWLGVGLDLFTFTANLPQQTVDSTIVGVQPRTPTAVQTIDFNMDALALDVRVRYPLLASEAFPKGRLQPYASFGPAFFNVRVQNKGNGELTTRTASDTVVGYKLGAGASWALTRDLAAFGEWRFTRFHAAPQLQGTITGASVPLDFTLKTHHLVAGLSVRF